MARYYMREPGGEAKGGSLTATFASIRREIVEPVLRKRLAEYGFEQLEPDEWYPYQLWLDVMNDLVEQEGFASPTFVSIGLKIIETADFPPGLDELPFQEILARWDDAYLMNNRGPGIGAHRCEVVDGHHVKVIKTTPLPDDFEYGVAYGFARRFLPAGTHFTIYYDEEAARMDQGGEETIIHVVWGKD